MIKKIIFLFLFSLFSVVLLAQQTKEELQRKQQDLLKEIRDLNSTLKKSGIIKTGLWQITIL